MPSSLVKFANRASSGDQKLFWGRSDRDGLPYRGPHAPMMTDDEFEGRAVRVADARNAFFDVFDPESNKQFLEVMECWYNGWFQVTFIERFWEGPDGKRTHYHYIEWVEYYMEDGSRTPYLSSGQTELAHGQQVGGFNP